MARKGSIQKPQYKKEPLPKWFRKLELPAGWKCVSKIRGSGKSKGQKDMYYIDPEIGHKFRSQPEVLYYLETGNLKEVGKKKVKNHNTAKSGKANQDGDSIDKTDPKWVTKGNRKENMKESNSADSPMEGSIDEDEGWHDFALAPVVQVQENKGVQAVMQEVEGPTTDHEQDMPLINGNLLVVDAPLLDAVIHHVDVANIDHIGHHQVLGADNGDIWSSLNLDTIVDLEVAGNFNFVETGPNMLAPINDYVFHEDIGFWGHDVHNCTDMEFYLNLCNQNNLFTQTSDTMEVRPGDFSEQMDQILEDHHGQPETTHVHDAPLEDASNLRDVAINELNVGQVLARSPEGQLPEP